MLIWGQEKALAFARTALIARLPDVVVCFVKTIISERKTTDVLRSHSPHIGPQDDEMSFADRTSVEQLVPQELDAHRTPSIMFNAVLLIETMTMKGATAKTLESPGSAPTIPRSSENRSPDTRR